MDGTKTTAPHICCPTGWADSTGLSQKPSEESGAHQDAWVLLVPEVQRHSGSRTRVAIRHGEHRDVMVRASIALAFAVMPDLCLAAEFPDCAVRSGKAGGPAILINGQTHSPLFFSANNQFDRDEVLVEQMKRAVNAGVVLQTINLYGFQTGDEIRAVLDRFCGAVPGAYFYIRCWVGPSQAWLSEHPDDAITKADGSRIGMASVTSEAWRQATCADLQRLVTVIAQTPYADRVIGIMPTYLQTGEWFYPDTDDFMDYSPANRDAFRAWLKRKYKSNEALAKVWHMPGAALDTAEIPPPGERDQRGWGPFRSAFEHAAVIDFQQFQSESMVETIELLARTIKESSRNRLLVGVFFGYTLELNGNGPRALAHSGHLAFAELLESSNIDLVHAPYSYFERALGQPSHMHFPVDSIALHGKLAIIEDDTFTHLAPPPDDAISSGYRERAGSLAETLSLTRRNFGSALMHRCGLWYFDIFSRGMWNDPDFWQSTSLQRRLMAEIRSEPRFEPEIAFVVSERSVDLLADTTHPLLMQSLYLWRSELARIGAPVGYYLQSDLPRLPSSVKLVVLANAYSISRDERRAAEKIAERGGTLVYVYAPDVWGPEGPDHRRIGAITGMDIRPIHDDQPMQFLSTEDNVQFTVDAESWKPRFVIASGGHHVLATYADTNEVAVAARPMGKGALVYAAIPRLPVTLMRSLATRSGVTLYVDRPTALSIAGAYLIVHTDTPGPANFQWPAPLARVERTVPFGTFTLAENARGWNDTLVAGTTFVYRCNGPQTSRTPSPSKIQ